jgi:predicted glycosyltransferase
MYCLRTSGEMMKIIVEIGHPAHVHHFKNMIWELKKKGHEILVCAVDKEVSLDLLDAYGFKYEVLGVNRGKGIIGKIPFFLESELKMFSIARKFKPDMFISRGSPFSAHMSRLFRSSSISFNDTEHSTIVDSIVFPFMDAILTPICFKRDLGAKQIRYKGNHELAYLHPDYFSPNPGTLQEIGLTENDTFSVLRFVSWEANHDVGQTGLTLETKREAIRILKEYGRVMITSEKPLDAEFEQYRVSVSPEKMHDLLYYATLLYGESATMASECAILGTHSIFCDFAGRGYTDEEEEKYDLVYNFKLDKGGQASSIEKVSELIRNPSLKEEGRKKGEYLVKDMIDVTAYMVDYVENYGKLIE